MLTLIENGEIYAPAPRGKGSVFLANEKIEKIGRIRRSALDDLGCDHEVFDPATLSLYEADGAKS